MNKNKSDFVAKICEKKVNVVLLKTWKTFLVWNSVHKIYLKIILYLKSPPSLCSYTQPVN
jgi:hypothetical protein